MAQEVRHPAHHFLGCLVREREQQNPVGGNPLLQQVRHAVDERAGLARTCAGNHQGRSGRRAYRRVLLLVEFTSIFDLQMDRRAEWLQHIFAGH